MCYLEVLKPSLSCAEYKCSQHNSQWWIFSSYVIKVFENIHIVIPFLHDLQRMLLGFNCTNLLSLLIKISGLKITVMDMKMEQIHILSFPYVVCALPLQCISLLCLFYRQRCLMVNGGEFMCWKQKTYRGAVVLQGREKTLSCCICGIRCNYHHPLCEQSLLLS